MERLHGKGLAEFDMLTLTDDATRQDAIGFCDAEGRVVDFHAELSRFCHREVSHL